MEQQQLPNATTIIVLGILGYLCCCFAGLGIIPSTIAFFMANKSQKMYEENPQLYTNISTIKTGKIVAIIAVVLNTMALVNTIYSLSTGNFGSFYDEFSKGFKEGFEGTR